MAAGIWVRLVRHGRTVRDEMIPCGRQDLIMRALYCGF